MKLDNFHQQEELKVLSEGIRFTTKEINKVKKNSRNILVGFEFEFNPVPFNVERVRQGEEPRDSSQDEADTTPREEWTLDDVWETQEHQDAEMEAEEEAIREWLDEKKSEFESEKEDEYNEEWEPIHEMIEAFSTAKNKGDMQIPTMFAVTMQSISKIHDKVGKYINATSTERPTDKELEKYFTAIQYLIEVQKFIKEYDLDEAMENIETEDPQTYAENFREYYSDSARHFIEFFRTDQFEAMQTFLRDLAEAWLPASEEVLNKAREIKPEKWQS